MKIYFIAIFLLITFTQESKNKASLEIKFENKYKEKNEDGSKIKNHNTFVIKTELTQEELDEILSENYSSSFDKKRRRGIENLHHYKSKDNNNTILLLDISNKTDFRSENEISQINENEKLSNDRNIRAFLSVKDIFFEQEYQEMFGYLSTIIVFFVILVAMLIFLAFEQPKEIGLGRSLPTEEINEVKEENEEKQEKQD